MYSPCFFEEMNICILMQAQLFIWSQVRKNSNDENFSVEINNFEDCFFNGP